jgi:two-component system response regulator NreC
LVANPDCRGSSPGYAGAVETTDQNAVGTKTTTVVIADDHAVVRSGLKTLLDAEPGFEVTGEARDLRSTMTFVRAQRPDVLVLDLNMPDEPSLPAIPELLAASPKTAIVVLTMQNDPAFAREALRAGALGYVLKECANAELVSAIRAATEGRTYLQPQLGAQLAAEPLKPDDGADTLSDRETEVLRLIALGHTNTEIAEQLYLSVRTVESHRAHIQQKLLVSTRAELVRYALDHDLLDLSNGAGK